MYARVDQIPSRGDDEIVKPKDGLCCIASRHEFGKGVSIGGNHVLLSDHLIGELCHGVGDEVAFAISMFDLLSNLRAPKGKDKEKEKDKDKERQTDSSPWLLLLPCLSWRDLAAS
ncbi:uncharacterized protein PG986_007963 [Apiospora aurea]|uniref:Uncharacterized protein n=1 Tax=Apiospora aurea TaxID=335848 RepID=A0ABR1QE32_9PEZI